MIIRSKAPLRLGLAGGTDVSPYSDIYGGAILNATIDLYAYTTIIPTSDNKIVFELPLLNKQIEFNASLNIPVLEGFELICGVYNKIAEKYLDKPQGFKLSSFIDVPQGSGLGTSSTIVVSILGAFVEWFKLPLGKYDIAHLAYEIERVDLKMSGGKQDQYAATFGGFNFIEFFADDRVIVNPLNLKNEILHELEICLLLFYTDTQRLSATIIDEQKKSVINKNDHAIEAMHQLKNQAIEMKEFLLKGELSEIGKNLHKGWTNKKKMANSISNSLIDEIYEKAINAGASGGKISGAGGGGFMFFYCPENTRIKVQNTLTSFGGRVQNFNFTQNGLITWTI